MCTSLLLALPVLLGTTYTVDDDAPADFADLPAAIAFATGGDTLLVQPGTYSAFQLTEDLTILGPAAGPAPLVPGLSTVTGAGGFALRGLSLARLLVRGGRLANGL